jgi:hypothetical protein
MTAVESVDSRAAVETWRDVVEIVELPAGPDQVLVVYRSADTGNELDPTAIFGAVAADAAARASRGEWIVTIAVMPLRHAGQVFSEASGYETKDAIAVVYGRGPVGASATGGAVT